MDNLLRTGVLIAALTALFMAVGYWVSGPQGMVVALLVAAAMNLVTYWTADRLVLMMYGAHEVDESRRLRCCALCASWPGVRACQCRRSI